MKRFAWMMAVVMGIPVWVGAGEIHVDTKGVDTQAGTAEAPLASIQAAVDRAVPGDVIRVHAGTYKLASVVRLSKSGTAEAPITVEAADPAAIPVLDFSDNPSKEDRGIQLNADYWRLKSLIVQKAPDNGVNIAGSNNVVENVTARQNRDSGFQISGSESKRAANNLLLNCDSYENYDPQNRGENADGFAIKFRNLGPGNVLRGCRAWRNSDDGYDSWAAANGVTLEECQAFDNGIDFDKLGNRFAGDGNGFKLGQDSGTHVLKRCLAWDNPGNGFDINGNARNSVKPNDPITHGVEVTSCVSFRNGRNFAFNEAFPHKLSHNVSIAGKQPDTLHEQVVQMDNTWSGSTDGEVVAFSQFAKPAPRKADGSLPSHVLEKLIKKSEGEK